MATALDLLMNTKEDVNLLSEESDICTIDAKTRAIFVPSTIVVGGVQSDKNAERIKFSCPKIVGDNLDLSKFSVRINFENVSSVDFNVSIKDQYICDDVAVDGENVTFSWLIGRNAARYMGTVRFIVCAVKTDSDSNISVEWNTAIAEVPVLEGIEIDQPQIGQEEKDVINQLLELTKNTSAEAVQNVNSAKEQAIKDIQSVSQPDTSLTIEGGLAEAKATGEAIDSLKEDLDKALPNGYAKMGAFDAKWEQQGINSDGTISNITNAASVGKTKILNIPTSFKLVSKDSGYKFNVCEFSKNGDEYIFKKFTEINGVAYAEFNAGFYKIGFFDITESPLDYYNMSESDRVKLVESHYELYFNKLPFTAYSEFEKPFVIFSFDWYSDSWQKYQIMKPLGLNATFCLDTQTSDYNISDGLTRNQFDEMLENGWDWALYGTIGDRGNTKDSWKAAISAGLKQKENMGIFNPVMYNTPDNNSAEYITEACKELGFLMQRCFINGENYIRSRTQYRTGANYLTNASIDNCKAYVEKAILNKCGVCFYAHNMSDTSDLSESNFKKFIEYIAQKVKKGEIEVLSARDYASKYLTDQLILNDYKASIKQGAFLHKLIN